MQNKDVKNSLSSNRFTFRSETFTNDLPRNLQLMRDLVGSGCGYVEVYLQLISVTSSESYNIKVGVHHVLALTVFNLEAKSTQVKNKFYKNISLTTVNISLCNFSQLLTLSSVIPNMTW